MLIIVVIFRTFFCSELLPYYSSKYFGTTLSVGTDKKDVKAPVHFARLQNMEGKAPDGVLPSTRDRFRGQTVDTDLTAIDVTKFPDQLQSDNKTDDI